MKRIFFTGLVFVTLLAGCGDNDTPVALPNNTSVATGVAPVVINITPTTGKAGDTITIAGLGFSSAATANIVTIGGIGTEAVTHTLLNPPQNGAAEAITVKVPAGAKTGTAGIFVTVFELTSNADVQFTVIP